ncbi:MAG: enoyl-CoA hydratase [Erythrobacter sp.]|nr:enoyl-CoA hydratase [Erythrobacter sp.]MDJ0976957.1 enoyl-CoA hydratase [Erythrobacter sp.]
MPAAKDLFAAAFAVMATAGLFAYAFVPAAPSII